MADELLDIANQFSGLDMTALIGGPLRAVCDAQTMMARATLDFIDEVGLEAADSEGVRKVRTTNFSFSRPTSSASEDGRGIESVRLNVPFLAMVNVPALSVDKACVTFDMAVKSSVSSESKSDKKGEIDAKAGLKIGPFHMDVKIKGSISCHEGNTRKSDNSAKYHVSVEASQQKTPEGLMRLLDMLNEAIAPIPQPRETEE